MDDVAHKGVLALGTDAEPPDATRLFDAPPREVVPWGFERRSDLRKRVAQLDSFGLDRALKIVYPGQNIRAPLSYRLTTTRAPYQSPYKTFESLHVAT